ncbi:serine/threonine-protein kinase ATR isoform X2 [Neocloeon triangulifer]|uniref:serine/threonine-protein kinase ATR isoform X2 n=1 Tax=Neocloeon triangulifer TaxID=2078957 RepID=UPI00286F1128|nr:serine/threonine-protein kinase ATR isoform X2 [Neocloeon triangulifer]
MARGPHQSSSQLEKICQDWMSIIEILLSYINRPKLIKSKFRLSFNHIIARFEEAWSIFCPEIEMVPDPTNAVLDAYQDFLSAFSNCLMILLTKDLDHTKVPGISAFYEKLFKTLYLNCSNLYLYLMDKHMSSLKNILDVYVNPVGFYPPISIGTYSVANSSRFPGECRSLVRLASIESAKPVVSFLSDVIFSSYELVLQSPLRLKLLDLYLQRLGAWDLFNYNDLISNKFLALASFPFRKDLDMLPCFVEICTDIVSKEPLEASNSKLLLLQDQVAQMFLSQEFSVEDMAKFPFPTKLKAAVMKYQCDDDGKGTQSKLVKLLCKFMCKGVVKLTDLEIKWLAHNFCGTANNVSGSLMMAFLEYELRCCLAGVHPNKTEHGTVPHSKSHVKHSINVWINAGDVSQVWQIASQIFTKKLERLAQVEDQKHDCIVADVGKLHLIMNGLQVIVCRIEIEQKKASEFKTPPSFVFFPGSYEKVVAQMGILPNHCIELIPSKGKAPSLENVNVSIKLWREVLEMLNALRLLPESSKLEASELNSIEILCGLPWLNKQDKADIPANKLEWYQILAESLQKKLKGEMPESLSVDTLKVFGKELNKTSKKPTAWRVNVVRDCLMTYPEELEIVMPNLPVIISSCHRSDIKPLYQVFSKILNHQSEKIIALAAEVLPSIVCALSGCCEVQEFIKENEASSPKGWNFLNLLDNFSADWKNVILHSNPAIRRAIAKGFPQIIKHLGSSFSTADVQLWVKLLSDEDASISDDFVCNLPSILNLRNDTEYRQEAFKIIINELNYLIENTWRGRKSWDIVLAAMDPILKMQSDFAVKPVMKMILKLIALKKDDICGLNQEVVVEFFNSNHMDPMVAFFQSQDEIWSAVIETLSFQDPNKRNIIYCFERICNIFGFKSVTLRKHLFHFLRVLIPKCYEDTTFLDTLEDTALYLNVPQKSIKSMLTRFHAMLYPMFVVNYPDNYLDFYLKLAGCDDEVSRYLTLIIIQVILNFHSSSEDIYKKLTSILKGGDDKTDLSPEEISQDLQSHMMGILVTIQSNVVSKYASTDLKVRSLVGFKNLLKLVSTEAISPVFNKILDVICTFKTLKEPELVKAYCSLVLTFLEHLEKSKLGAVMFTIMTNLTFLDLEKFKTEAKLIVDFFLVKNRKNVKPNSEDLFNLTDLLKEFGLNKFLEDCLQCAKSLSTDEMLEIKLNAISNNYVENQILALKCLKKYFITIQPEIQRLFFAHNLDSHSSLNAIIGKLVSGASSPNPSLRVPSIECLSELGAIDPSHWIVAYGFKDRSKFFLDSSCAEFVCRALETLLDGFQSSTKKEDMDIIGYVCQEFMKANHFQNEPAKAPVQIWNLFSEQSKTMLMPFFTSNYISKITIEADELPHPLISSQYGEAFEDWILHWVARLIGYIKNKSIKDTFDALKLVFRINLKNASFFLPHIFINAVWAATPEEIDLIVEEMVTAAHLHESSCQVSEEESFEIVFKALRQNVGMQSSVELHLEASNSAQKETNLKCSKVIFSLIDYIIRWNLEFEQALLNGAPSKRSMASTCSESSRDVRNSPLAYKYRKNRDFMDRFNLKLAAEQNHSCNENFRALRYLDIFCVEKNREKNVEGCLNLFLRIHSQLQNIDFVHGVSSIRKRATGKSEQLLLYEMNGELQESIIWCEKMMCNKEGDVQEILGYVTKTYLQLDQHQPVIGIFEKHFDETNSPKFNGALLASKLESHWRMAAWEDLNKTLSDTKNSDFTWAYHFAKILDSIFRGDYEDSRRSIYMMREDLGNWLNKCGPISSPYATNYPAFLLMHLLTDVEIMIKILLPSEKIGSLSEKEQVAKIKEAFYAMEFRQKRISFAWKGLQMALSVRRTLLSLLQHVLAGFSETGSFIRKELGRLWMESAKISINHRQFPQALGYLISSEQCGLKETFVLQAQLEWEKGSKELALIYLHRGINKYFPDWEKFEQIPTGTRVEDRRICAEAKLLIAKYSSKMKIVDDVQAIFLYKQAVKCYPQSEESWVHLARAYETVKKSTEKTSGRGKNYYVCLKEIVKCYTFALMNGVKYLYESLPRVITIWADSLNDLQDLSTEKNDNERKMVTSAFNFFDEHMKDLRKNLPPYAFYACFNNLSARLCSSYRRVYTFIQEIFVDLLQAHPYQTLWKLVPMIKVSHVIRVNRVQEVLIKFGAKNGDMNRLMEAYVVFNSFLYDLGHFQIKTQSSKVLMTNIAPKLVEFFKRSQGSRILMPTEDLISVVLPDDSVNFKTHNAFPREPVYITRVMEPVQVFASLQKPKKFSLLGSDDKEYSWLVKNKDDLRIDSTVMHFMQALNALLDQNTECKERRLSCKTYSVVPLGEDCGLIEFIPNLITMRQVIMDLYKGKGEKNETKEEIKKGDNIETKCRIFEKCLIPAHPSVLSDWFNWKFPDHSAWNEARKKFIYSTAVMSVVGYILGLGDRHGGNIMLNNLTGESIHVDYNCLFNKGETLPWPEKVPFRLTHNMIKAMGVAGMEGPYRKAVELTVAVMRNNAETLFGVLSPIKFDATIKDRLGENSNKQEFINTSVDKSLRRVQMRLAGILNDKLKDVADGMILSPEGHAKAIINQATDIKNLCQMYPGWGAFL